MASLTDQLENVKPMLFLLSFLKENKNRKHIYDEDKKQIKMEIFTHPAARGMDGRIRAGKGHIGELGSKQFKP